MFFSIVLNTANSVEKNEPDKLIIEADTSIEYFEDKQVYIASGNARAFKGNLILRAQNITAFMEKKNTNNKIKKIIAKGNVYINKDEQIAKSDIADYDFNNKVVILRGKYQSFKNSKIKIESTKFIKFDDFRKKAYSEGDVKLYLQNSIKVFSNQLNANFKKNDNSIINATASGQVKITTKLETIHCDSAKFENVTGIIFITGNVKIKKGNSIITSEKGLVNLKTGKSKIFSTKSKRVKGVFSPVK